MPPAARDGSGCAHGRHNVRAGRMLFYRMIPRRACRPYAIKRGRTERPPQPKSKSRRAKAEERPRIGPPRRIADLMHAIGAAAFRKFGFVQSSLVTRWAEIDAPHYAATIEPDSIPFPLGNKASGTLQPTVMSGHAPIIHTSL